MILRLQEAELLLDAVASLCYGEFELPGLRRRARGRWMSCRGWIHVCLSTQITDGLLPDEEHHLHILQLFPNNYEGSHPPHNFISLVFFLSQMYFQLIYLFVRVTNVTAPLHRVIWKHTHFLPRRPDAFADLNSNSTKIFGFSHT